MVYTCTFSKDWSDQHKDIQYVVDCSVYDKGIRKVVHYSKEQPFQKILRTHSIYIGH
jgi:hypothetical protein